MDKTGAENSLERVRQLRDRQNELMKVYLLVLSMILVSYLFGLMGFSLAWVFIIAFFTFVVWRRRIIRMNEEFLSEQEHCIQRRRALKNNETCEWLNFIVNRWFVFASSNFSEVFKGIIDTLMDSAKPYFLSSIHLKSLNAQSGSPQLKEIYSFEMVQGAKRTTIKQASAFFSSLSLAQKYQVVLEAAVEMHSEDLMNLEAVLGQKWLGISLEVAIESFSLVGRVHVIVNMDKDVAFPHISSLSLSFIQKPALHFGVRVLRHIQLMEIPFLKMWLHTMVSDTLLEAFVDPGKLEISLRDVERLVGRGLSAEPAPIAFAIGVLTVAIDGYIRPTNEKSSKSKAIPFEVMKEKKYLAISLGKQHYSNSPTASLSSFPQSPSSFSSSSSSSETTFKCVTSFLVYDLEEDILKVKLKSQLFLSKHSLAQVQLPLTSFDLTHKLQGNTTVDEVLEDTSENVRMGISLEFTAVEDFQQAIQKASQSNPELQINSGVLSVCVHGASDLLGMDADGLSDPYCLLYNSGKKVSSTHYVARSRNPKWDVYTQFIVEDISKVVLSFVVYDWDGVSMSEDDFLGSTHIIMAHSPKTILHQCYPLLPTLLATPLEDDDVINRGNLIISIIFTPVLHIPKQASEHASAALENPQRSSKVRRLLSSPETQESDLPAEGIIQLNIIQAKDLLAKDRNGFSDPFLDVLIGGDKKFTSEVVKKNLSPEWNERCDLEMPAVGENLEIIVWDHDLISKNDFLGSLTFSRSQLIQLANNYQFEGWFELESVEHGSIQLGFKVFVQEDGQEGDGDGGVMEIGGGRYDEIIGANYKNTGNKKGSSNSGSSNKKETSKLHASQSNHSMPMDHSPQYTNATSESTDGSTFLSNDKVASGSSANISLISTKIEEFDKEFKSASRLTLKPDLMQGSLYEGITIEVLEVNGLAASSKLAVCKVKLNSSVHGYKARTLACSPPFLPDHSVTLNFRFQIGSNGVERADSSLSFKVRSGRFNVLCRMVVLLADILPDEARQTRRSVLSQEGTRMQLSCTFLHKV